jgi:hypothetical protein
MTYTQRPTECHRLKAVFTRHSKQGDCQRSSALPPSLEITCCNEELVKPFGTLAKTDPGRRDCTPYSNNHGLLANQLSLIISYPRHSIHI